jgi:hypothetical protein
LALEDASPFNLVYKITGELKHVNPKEKSGKGRSVCIPSCRYVAVPAEHRGLAGEYSGTTDKILIDD